MLHNRRQVESFQNQRVRRKKFDVTPPPPLWRAVRFDRVKTARIQLPSGGVDVTVGSDDFDVSYHSTFPDDGHTIFQSVDSSGDLRKIPLSCRLLIRRERAVFWAGKMQSATKKTKHSLLHDSGMTLNSKAKGLLKGGSVLSLTTILILKYNLQVIYVHLHTATRFSFRLNISTRKITGRKIKSDRGYSKPGQHVEQSVRGRGVGTERRCN